MCSSDLKGLTLTQQEKKDNNLSVLKQVRSLSLRRKPLFTQVDLTHKNMGLLSVLKGVSNVHQNVLI